MNTQGQHLAEAGNAGNTEPLLFAAAADNGVIAVFQAQDEAMDAGLLTGCDHFFIRDLPAGAVNLQIVHDGIVE